MDGLFICLGFAGNSNSEQPTMPTWALMEADITLTDIITLIDVYYD